MQLVNHQFVPGGHLKVVVGPIKIWVVYYRGAGRVGHLPRVRVVTVKFLALAVEVELVLIAGSGLGHIDGPVAIGLRLKRVFLSVPTVERADYSYLFGVGRPYPEGGAGGMRHGAHAGLQSGAEGRHRFFN